MSDAVPNRAVCLGCGCLCDDIEIRIDEGRIANLVGACPLGERWFGDGVFPNEARMEGRPGSLEAALDKAAPVLFAEPGGLLVYVAGDVTCEAMREAVALADRLGASVDGITSDTVAEGILTAQRRGRATGTLGELRHRTDVVLFWGVDPAVRYPRFIERFISESSLLSTSRRLVAVDVGDRRGPDACSERVRLDPDEEVDALSLMRAAVLGRGLGELPPNLAAAAELARESAATAKYVGLVFDAEPLANETDEGRTEGIVTLAQALNGPTRAAAWGLRGGGNRNGFESLLTWQTGYPFAVDFAAGFPSYVAEERASERIGRGRYVAALVVGNVATIPAAVAAGLRDLATVVVGPWAGRAEFGPRVTIETGAAGLHEGGLVLRMDDIPLDARAVLAHERTATDVLRRLATLAPVRSTSRVG